MSASPCWVVSRWRSPGRRCRRRSWRRRHAAALVKILALVPGRRLHREQLIDTLWPELTVEEAAPRLHKAAHYARRALGDPDSVVLAGEMVALWPDVDVQVDAAVFQAQAEAALSARDAAAAGAAADRYRGDLLPEDPYESWAAGRPGPAADALPGGAAAGRPVGGADHRRSRR